MVEPGKIFQQPEWLKKQIDEIINSEKIQLILKDAKNQESFRTAKSQHTSLRNLVLLPGWLSSQYDRYDKVYASIEGPFKSMDKILPPERDDFMDWFFNKYALRGDLRKLKIEVVHFQEYHEEIISQVEPPMPWTGLFEKLKFHEYIFTTKYIFHDAMKYKNLPEDTQILWLESKADAMKFQEAAGFSKEQFNKCFVHLDGKQFAGHNKTVTEPKDPLKSILEKFFSSEDK